MSLLVVGTLAFDSVKTPFGERKETLGGSASFLGTSASYFAPVRLVAPIGEDFPKEHMDFYTSRDMDTAGIEKMAGKTFRWSGYYNDNLNVAHTLETQLNVLADFEPKIPDTYRDTSHVMLGNFDPDLQSAVLDQLSGPKLVAADTMNFWIEGKNAELKRTLARVDLLSVNDQEARDLSGEYNLVKASRIIRAMGPSILVVKRGEYGALVFTEDGVFAAPAYPLETIRDPTGAGDSFAGGMLGYLAMRPEVDTPTLRQAVVLGSVMASFAVEDFSLDRFRSLDRADIQERYRSFQALTHFDSTTNDLWQP